LPRKADNTLTSNRPQYAKIFHLPKTPIQSGLRETPFKKEPIQFESTF